MTELRSRREFLGAGMKWSKAVVAGVLAGGVLVTSPEAVAQRRGAWANRRGGGGRAWSNGARGGGAWRNGGGGRGAWANRYGGGAWGNRSGGIVWGNRGYLWGNRGVVWGNGGIVWGNGGLVWANRR